LIKRLGLQNYKKMKKNYQRSQLFFLIYFSFLPRIKNSPAMKTGKSARPTPLKSRTTAIAKAGVSAPWP